MNISPPLNEATLLARASSLSGLSFQELSSHLGLPLPQSLRLAKGWVGQLLEKALGADAKSKAEPDFTGLGIELKTLPLDESLRPQESTYVCTLPLKKIPPYQNSVCAHKLNRVLWVPVEASKQIPLPTRRLGRPFIWSPSPAEAKQLQTDWDEITEPLLTGEVEALSAKIGCYLHVRPKAMNAKALTSFMNTQGELAKTLPRGLYLRTSFTQLLLNSHQTTTPEPSPGPSPNYHPKSP